MAAGKRLLLCSRRSMKAGSAREKIPEGGRVFLVDDDAGVRRALTRLLRAAGLEVLSFASADALLPAIDAGKPSCVVADLRMPGRNGLDLQDELTRRGL